jgi:hypothetical protein
VEHTTDPFPLSDLGPFLFNSSFEPCRAVPILRLKNAEAVKNFNISLRRFFHMHTPKYHETGFGTEVFLIRVYHCPTADNTRTYPYYYVVRGQVDYITLYTSIGQQRINTERDQTFLDVFRRVNRFQPERIEVCKLELEKDPLPVHYLFQFILWEAKK